MYVTGPETVRDFTGVRVSRLDLGGARVHDVHSGVSSLIAPDEVDEAIRILKQYRVYLIATKQPMGICE